MVWIVLQGININLKMISNFVLYIWLYYSSSMQVLVFDIYNWLKLLLVRILWRWRILKNYLFYFVFNVVTMWALVFEEFCLFYLFKVVYKTSINNGKWRIWVTTHTYLRICVSAFNIESENYTFNRGDNWNAIHSYHSHSAICIYSTHITLNKDLSGIKVND